MKYELGPLETEIIFTLEREKKTIFSIQDVKKFINTSDSNLRKILYRLTIKGRIQRVKKGIYILVPARAGYQTSWTEDVLSFIDEIQNEYYVGYWTAFNYWQMTEQIPLTIFIATTKRNRNFIYNDIVPIHFITLSPYKFFGYIKEHIADKAFYISDKEKTIIDSLDLPHYCGGISEVSKGLYHNINWDKMIEYSINMNNKTIKKRLGYLIEVLNLDISNNFIKKLQSEIGSAYSWLDPSAPKNVIKHNTKWKLKININIESLRGDSL